MKLCPGCFLKHLGEATSPPNEARVIHHTTAHAGYGVRLTSVAIWRIYFKNFSKKDFIKYKSKNPKDLWNL